MTEYVAGFAFQDDQVALIRKNKPEWQRGRLNGIGGKIELGETPIQAMVREFEEETGFHTNESYWWDFVTLQGKDFVVHFFFSQSVPLEELETTTDEEIVVIPIKEVTVHNAIPNLTWLLPMAKSMTHDRADKFEVKEAT